MRRVPRILVGLATASVLLLPSASAAYSEWPVISSWATQLSLEKNLHLRCCLHGHVGDIYLEGPGRNFPKIAEFLMELGHYLREHTNAGSYYQIRVHFEDRVRTISIRDLERFHHRIHADINDPKVLYAFFTLFRND